jgi:flagellar biosynthetic protein FliQ
VTSDTVLQMVRDALWVGAKISLPILIAVLVVGLVVGILQSVTQLQEPTLSFVPKLIVVAAVLLLAGQWMLNEIVTYTHAIILNASSLIGG